MLIVSLEKYRLNINLAGDYNLNLLKINNDELCNEFFDLITSHSLLPQITLPTRLSQTSGTLIDNILCKAHISIKPTTAGILLNKLSDHQPCFIILDIACCGCNNPKFIRKYVQLESVIDNINSDIRSSGLDDNIDTGMTADPNIGYSIIHDVIEKTKKTHMTSKLVKYNKYKHKQSKWITRGLLRSLRFRDNLYKKIKLTNPASREYETLRIHLKTYNTILRTSICAAKKKFLAYTFEKYKADIRNTWKYINEVLSKKGNKNTSPTSLNVNGNAITNTFEITNMFNTFFTNIGNELANKIKYSGTKDFTYYLRNRQNQKFTLNEVNEQTVTRIIENIPAKNSCGYDDISSIFLKQIATSIIKPLTIVINQVLNNGIFPDKLKIAKVVPIFKSGDCALTNTYRPISLLPVISKVIEKIIYTQLSLYFESNKLFSDSQYGFRPNHSTEQATLELTDRIISAMDNNDVQIGIFLDLSKAFDTIDHAILLSKLEHYGVDGIPLQLVKSYLTNRKQYVKINEVNSNLLPINTGVPQGSILGPLLFIIYINDFARASSIFDFICYADDTTLFSTLNNLVNAQNINPDIIINKELAQINEWLEINKLSLNVTKTKFMVFHTQHKHRAIKPHVPKINNTNIEKVEQFKFLGLTLDSNLNWKKHSDNITNKCSQIIGILNRLKQILPQNIKIMLYNALLLPYINYCLVTWGYQCKRINILQKRAIRLITLSTYNCHTAPLFKKLKLLTIKDMLALQELKFYYKLTHNELPAYFQNWQIVTNSELHRHDTRRKHDIHIVGFRHTFAKRCIRINLPQTVNNTPESVKDKLFTHSFRGFVNFAKLTFLQNYKTECTMANCYICDRVQH